METATHLVRSQEISRKVAQLFKKRVELAQEHYKERVQTALKAAAAELTQRPLTI